MSKGCDNCWPGFPACGSPLRILAFVGTPGTIRIVYGPMVRVPPITTMNWYVPGAPTATKSHVMKPVPSLIGIPPAHVTGDGLVGSTFCRTNPMLGIGDAVPDDTTAWTPPFTVDPAWATIGMPRCGWGTSIWAWKITLNGTVVM